MDKEPDYGKIKPRPLKSEAKTSGESDTKAVIRIVRLPPVDIHAIRIKVTDIHELTVRITASLLYSSFLGNSDSSALGGGFACVNMRRTCVGAIRSG